MRKVRRPDGPVTVRWSPGWTPSRRATTCPITMSFELVADRPSNRWIARDPWTDRAPVTSNPSDPAVVSTVANRVTFARSGSCTRRERTSADRASPPWPTPRSKEVPHRSGRSRSCSRLAPKVRAPISIVTTAAAPRITALGRAASPTWRVNAKRNAVATWDGTRRATVSAHGVRRGDPPRSGARVVASTQATTTTARAAAPMRSGAESNRRPSTGSTCRTNPTGKSGDARKASPTPSATPTATGIDAAEHGFACELPLGHADRAQRGPLHLRAPNVAAQQLAEDDDGRDGGDRGQDREAGALGADGVAYFLRDPVGRVDPELAAVGQPVELGAEVTQRRSRREGHTEMRRGDADVAGVEHGQREHGGRVVVLELRGAVDHADQRGAQQADRLVGGVVPPGLRRCLRNHPEVERVTEACPRGIDQRAGRDELAHGVRSGLPALDQAPTQCGLRSREDEAVERAFDALARGDEGAEDERRRAYVGDRRQCRELCHSGWPVDLFHRGGELRGLRGDEPVRSGQRPGCPGEEDQDDGTHESDRERERRVCLPTGSQLASQPVAHRRHGSIEPHRSAADDGGTIPVSRVRLPHHTSCGSHLVVPLARAHPGDSGTDHGLPRRRQRHRARGRAGAPRARARPRDRRDRG